MLYDTDRWPQETRPCLSPVNLNLITATGVMSPFLGKAEIEIRLGSQKVLHGVLFADVMIESLACFLQNIVVTCF